MNYFFGQNGPGPLAGATVAERTHGAGAPGAVRPVGRDVYGGDSSLQSGLMASKRMEGSEAAYDMKSLGKHIEAVSVRVYSFRLCLTPLYLNGLAQLLT